MDLELLEKYCQFIRVIMSRINSHFEDQKEYIHCKQGCAHCCKNGEYPCSQLEFEFLKIGFSELEAGIQEKIIGNILKIKHKKENFKGKKFVYECPFLINDSCSIYPYRMIICRTFGLAYFDKEGEKNIMKAPFCMQEGLNYSEVYEPETKSFSRDLFNKTGYKNEPVAYNLGVEFLIEKFGNEIMGLDFGEIKTLIQWLEI